MRLPAIDPKLALIGLGLVGVGLWVWSKGGVAGAAQAAGQAAVEAVGGVAKGGIDAVSESVGIPTTSDTTTDAEVARWLIDREGYWTASFWCGVPALVKAMTMDAGTGKPPPAGSAIAREFGTVPNPADPAWHTADLDLGGSGPSFD